MNTDRRNLVNAIKIGTYNAERGLARRFFRQYTDPRDWLTIFRSVLQLSGRVMVDGTGGLRVALRPPDQPRVARHVGGDQCDGWSPLRRWAETYLRAGD